MDVECSALKRSREYLTDLIRFEIGMKKLSQSQSLCDVYVFVLVGSVKPYVMMSNWNHDQLVVLYFCLLVCC